MQSVAEHFLADELTRGLIQGGRDLEYMLFVDGERGDDEWSMRLENLIGIIERARLGGQSDAEIRAAVAMGLFPELFAPTF